MKEVIAKSKRYKHERQKAHMENMEKVDELDDEFENVMDDLSVANKGKEDNNSKSKFDLEYEMKVSEAKLDKRAKPTDRTKTEEEIRKEEEERKAEHEKKRLQRMEGEEDDDENRANGAVADDLGDDFGLIVATKKQVLVWVLQLNQFLVMTNLNKKWKVITRKVKDRLKMDQ